MNMAEKPVRVIEVIGPAGAGKSTLAELLHQTGEIQWVRTAPYFRRPKDLPFFVVNTLLMLRTLLLLYIHKSGRWFTPEEMAWMVILNGWSNTLRRQAEMTGRTIFVDEGPIFHLAYLFMRGPEILRSPYSQTWWQKMCRQVASTTDIIVWLNAPNDVLLRRIRARNNSYLFVSATDREICKFLDKLRESYFTLMSNLINQKSSIKILRFDTEKVHLNEISSQILDTTE